LCWYGTAILVGTFLSIRTQLMVKLEQNRVESYGELAEHVQSISNISTDQSNLERINPLECAMADVEGEAPFRVWPRDLPV